MRLRTCLTLLSLILAYWSTGPGGCGAVVTPESQAGRSDPLSLEQLRNPPVASIDGGYTAGPSACSQRVTRRASGGGHPVGQRRPGQSHGLRAPNTGNRRGGQDSCGAPARARPSPHDPHGQPLLSAQRLSGLRPLRRRPLARHRRLRHLHHRLRRGAPDVPVQALPAVILRNRRHPLLRPQDAAADGLHGAAGTGRGDGRAGRGAHP